MRVRVSAKIEAQLAEIRAEGGTNMYLPRAVQVIADQKGFPELVCWIEDHKGDYIKGILRGFKAE
jgi:hypothetical protein